MLRKAIIPVMLGVLGLSIGAIVRAQNATETRPSDYHSSHGTTAVQPAADASSAPGGFRRGTPLFGGRIPLPWSNAGSRAGDREPTPANPAASDSSSDRLLPVPRSLGDTSGGSETASQSVVRPVNDAAPNTEPLTGSSRLQQRLQALRSGQAEDYVPRTAAMPRPVASTRESLPTLAPQPQEPAGRAAPVVIGRESEAIGDEPGTSILATEPTTEVPPIATSSPRADLSGTEVDDALPSILTRRDKKPSDAAFSTRQEEPVADDPAEETPAAEETPIDSPTRSSRRQLSPEDAAAEQPAITSVSPGTAGVTNMQSLFSGQLPPIAVETVGSQTIMVGKEARFIVRAKNLGEVAVSGVTVLVNIPAAAELRGNTATSGAARFEPVDDQQARLEWKIARLDPNHPEELVLKLVPRDARSFEVAATWYVVPAQQSAQIRVLEPKLEMRLTGPAEVLYGDTKFYTITISNPGTGTTDNVSVNLLPINAGEESPGRTTIGAIEPGGRKDIEIELTARQAGTIQIRAEAAADGGLRTEASQDVLVRRANLDLAVDAPEVKYAGTVALYRMQITNNGDAAADTVRAVATLPAGSKYVVGEDGGTYDADRSTVSWLVGALRPGESREINLRCMLAMAGENQLRLSAEASGDLKADETASTRVEALADLQLQLDDPKGPLPVGEEVVYEVRVMNRGTKAAEGVRLVLYFSEGLEPVAVEGGRSHLEPGQVVFDAIPRVDAAQQVSFKIRARADTPGNHICRTELECSAPETRLVNEETTRFYGNAILSEEELEARRTPAPATAPLAPQPIESFR